VGVVAGIALENKDTILFLGAGLPVGSSSPDLDIRALAVAWAASESPSWPGPELDLAGDERLAQLTMARAIFPIRSRQPRQIVAASLAFAGPFLSRSARRLVWI